VSAYRGPLLLTWDRRFNDADEPPALSAADFPGKRAEWKGKSPPIALFDVPATGGKTVKLCDFASAGHGGTPYRSWLDIGGVKATEFSRQNPLRTSSATR